MLQDLQDSPFRGMGLPSREEIDAVLKVQKKDDSSVTAKIQGKQSNPSSAHAGEPHGSPRWPVHRGEISPEGVGPGGRMWLELGRYATYVDVALGLTRHWTLNKLQSMAVLLPAAFLDWKNMIMLVIDEISQVGGLTLAAVDSRLKQYRDDHHRPFGGIPMVMFFGDFFQFDPVLQTSLLLPTPRDPGGQRPDSSAKHLAAHKLFLQFTNVVILREQVRAAGCPRLRGFLRRLRSGEQTELDFQRLSQRLYTPSCKYSFVDGLRAITPLNQDRWDLNMAAVVQWARAHSKHISIFVAKHDTESGKRLNAGDLCHVLRYGDDSQLPTPGLFFYAQGMPVVVTRNQFVGLKVVNGAPFKAVDIFPDLAAGTIALANDVTLHLGATRGRPPFESKDNRRSGHSRAPERHNLDQEQDGRHPEPNAGQGRQMEGQAGFQVGHPPNGASLHTGLRYDRSEEPRQAVLQRPRQSQRRPLQRYGDAAQLHEPAILKLEQRGEETRRRFEQDHRHESWFQEWEAMPESGQGTETDDVEDAALWRDPGVSEPRS
ncbi:predicted protein [Chaetomium globosum CBS 148.51]|uniref:ATP-dependent DNA helicase n=1 Tax=Chaetomium globosum (strain ATCC 6205 / CBS 148.51 / DSM 1962 / NBRC 6347 / NRRL 1970) TaxID=306901 RepID=Q2GMV3_CHAGB|nr:uncharacterized protein CHGG_10701 [Chaetomium globosum CBS 148.51]EAQ84297.1 predicted protein [Chaetomium globosum CBS 148.51]